MLYLTAILGAAAFLLAVITMTSRIGYESAEYRVIRSEGKFEIREYPELVLAATNSRLSAKGRDGSFMRLFRYISGANQRGAKIAMTTPVFMEGSLQSSNVAMGFVLPKDITAAEAPVPSSEDVRLRTRESGKFAVVRFSGSLDSDSASKQEKSLRQWMAMQSIRGDGTAEAAGYDPPFTPGPLRRNEILIRIKEANPTSSSASNPS